MTYKRKSLLTQKTVWVKYTKAYETQFEFHMLKYACPKLFYDCHGIFHCLLCFRAASCYKGSDFLPDFKFLREMCLRVRSLGQRILTLGIGNMIYGVSYVPISLFKENIIQNSIHLQIMT